MFWKKVAGEEAQAQGDSGAAGAGPRQAMQRDLLGDHGVVVGGHDAAGRPQQQRRSAGESRRRAIPGRTPARTAASRWLIASMRDLASRHVDDFVPGPLVQKPDSREGRSRARHRRLARSDDGFAAGTDPGLALPRFDREVRRDLGAVAELARRGDDRRDGEVRAGQVLQQLAHLLALPAQLLGVGKVLVLAAAAAAEERAPRRSRGGAKASAPRPDRPRNSSCGSGRRGPARARRAG